MSDEKRKKKPPVIAPEETIEYLQKIEKILDDKESLEEEGFLLSLRYLNYFIKIRKDNVLIDFIN